LKGITSRLQLDGLTQEQLHQREQQLLVMKDDYEAEIKRLQQDQ